jgi:F-type H+-transporting ATPase subunit gamma
VLTNLAAGLADSPDAPRLLSGTGSSQRHLLVVCTAERGLAGAFSSSIARLARDTAVRLINEGKEVQILCVGRKGADILRRLFPDRLLDVVDLREVKTISFAEAEMIAGRVLEMFDRGEFDVATLFFSRFRSVIQQIPTAQQIIPAEVPEGAGDADTLISYEYEPEGSEILAELLPRNIAIQIFRALLENAASEQGARMSAMDSATRNAGEMIKKLTMNYNRSRQAQITKELIEIISGAEAL